MEIPPEIFELDYSSPITTDVSHCVELYRLCATVRPGRTLELGAGEGVSGVAIGLALNRYCAGAAATVVDLEEIPRRVPMLLWARFGVAKSYVRSDALAYLGTGDDVFDLVFHDADHGPARIPEYELCWRRARKVLAIHDTDLIDFGRFVASLNGVRRASETRDGRGRALGIIWREP